VITTLPADATPDGAAPPGSLRLALFTETYPPQLNGVSRTLERLVRAVEARGGEARVYTTTDPAVPVHENDVWRRPSIPFWAYPQLRLSAPIGGRLVADVRRWRPTLIHAATPFGMGLTGRAAALRLGIPLVTSYHTAFSEYAKFYRLGALSSIGWSFLRWFHNSGARTYVPTRAVAGELDAYGFRNLAIWGRGIESRRFNPGWRSSAWRQRLGADDDTIVVAYVGRLAIEKGLDVALAAMHRLAGATNPRIVFALAGDGPYAEYCRANAPAGTHFVGRIEGDALSAFFASADLFIFPSTTDTFGNVLLEAMASGLPVIAADVGPTRELLANGGGITVTPGDPAALVDAIQWLATDPARRRSLATEGVASAGSASWDEIFDELIADYRRVIAGVYSSAATTVTSAAPPGR
jgi:phosphatidylinositol alpha 1,6-mannosyltransferase